MLGYQVAVPGRASCLTACAGTSDRSARVAAAANDLRAGGGRRGRHLPGRGVGAGEDRAVDRRDARHCYRPADSLGALAAQAAEALRWSDRALVTVYHAQLDGTGHVFGCGSDAWRFQLGHVDKLAEQLATAISRGDPAVRDR